MRFSLGAPSEGDPAAAQTRKHMVGALRTLARLRDDPTLLEEAREWRDRLRDGD